MGMWSAIAAQSVMDEKQGRGKQNAGHSWVARRCLLKQLLAAALESNVTRCNARAAQGRASALPPVGWGSTAHALDVRLQGICAWHERKLLKQVCVLQDVGA